MRRRRKSQEVRYLRDLLPFHCPFRCAHVSRSLQVGIGSTVSFVEFHRRLVLQRNRERFYNVCSLLLWRHEASVRLYTFLWVAFVLTLLAPAAILFRFVGFYLVFKLMVLDYVYFRFPRLREKYDTSPLMWDKLPTDAEWAAKRKAEQVSRRPAFLKSRYSLCRFMRIVPPVQAPPGSAFESRSFLESFDLPGTENPLPGTYSSLTTAAAPRELPT